jgi:hypothetical protein
MQMGIRRQVVVDGCTEWATWWLEQRERKLRELLSGTMTINPLMAPLVTQLHGLDSGDQLVELLVTSHLMTGHATGFGKLIDEKIIPHVFGAEKLSPQFRRANSPFGESCFDDIDHVVKRQDGSIDLLSLKASTWTIQLAAAVQLNRAFSEISNRHRSRVRSINLGVFYGRSETLSDKYDIARGVNRGANHDVIDLTDFVEVHAGREFWAWLNDGESETQDWVLEGMIIASDKSFIRERAAALMSEFNSAVTRNYPPLGGILDTEAFRKLITGISG